jgi:hypothetical protein
MAPAQPPAAQRRQVIDTLKFASAANRSDECPGLRAQPHAELDSYLIGRVIDRPEPGDQAPGGRGDRRSGILKRLAGLLHHRGAILPEPAHHRGTRRLVDLNQYTAALVE